MPNELPLTFTAAALEPGRIYTSQELLDAIVERLAVSTETSFALFVAGSTAPTSNVGLWFNEALGTLNRWDDDAGEYVPTVVPTASLKYVLSADEPDSSVYLLWIVLDSNGQATDIRSYYDGAWRSTNKGTASTLVTYKSSGEGIESFGYGSAGQVPVSGGNGQPTAWGYAGIPIGMPLPWVAASAPPGFLLCQGQSVSRTTYAALFAVIGTTWGVGDGSTTFGIPDGRGRGFIGAGTGTATGATTHAVGEYAGEEKHTLTTGELAPHTHDLSEQVRSDDPDNPSGSVNWLGTGSGRTTGSTGTGTPFNVLGPAFVGNWVIRYA